MYGQVRQPSVLIRRGKYRERPEMMWNLLVRAKVKNPTMEVRIACVTDVFQPLEIEFRLRRRLRSGEPRYNTCTPAVL